MARLVAIEGGEDWSDASVDYLVVPDEVNLDVARAAQRHWYELVYLPAFRAHANNRSPFIVAYLGLPQFLIEYYGARNAEDSDIEVFSDGT